MKKQILLGALALVVATGSASAQSTALQATPGSMQQNDPRTATKTAQLHLQQTLGLSNDQMAKLYTPLNQYFLGTQKLQSQNLSATDLTIKQRELQAGLNSQMRAVLTPAQMKKYDTGVESTMSTARVTGAGTGNGHKQ